MTKLLQAHVIGEGVLFRDPIELGGGRKVEVFGSSQVSISTIRSALKRSQADSQITSRFFSGSIKLSYKNVLTMQKMLQKKTE